MPSTFNKKSKFEELIRAVKQWNDPAFVMEIILVNGRDKMVFTGSSGVSKVVVPFDYVGTESEARAVAEGILK